MSSDLFLPAPADLVWLQPWATVAAEGEDLVRELRCELSDRHLLFGVPVVAVARRTDCDDVLFATADPCKPLAVVHLTWRGVTEPDARWPRTKLYENWRDWIDRRLIPDHRDHSK
jgi:hypothetical protein